MPDIYLVIILLLFVFAIADLIVGVSNDAVNFLNSSIGSKVASRKVIMIIASLGILVGATFSSGMMDIARSGVFNPQFFNFHDVMILFLAVMITDVILLDLFNTFGMPTSTTVSIVFELLGAAVMVALIKLITNNISLSEIGSYINTTKAVAIVSGIFLSILFAFSAGMIVQFFSRLIFSFNYKKNLNIIGALWAGIALTALTYFLVFKGLKGASFVTDQFMTWVKSNTLWLFFASLVFWVSLLYTLVRFKVNIFKIVVLFGTFSLAMAFAGNDLVNFIGVPIAGLESFLSYGDGSILPKELNMGFLKKPVKTNSLLLVGAGTIMILTLWFSKKAQSVTETEVNLGRQDEGAERFKSNWFARWIVRNTTFAAKALQKVVPASWLQRANKSFEKVEDETGASFDLIRAAVNLTVASVLVALATSFKLPLSTTYVSFMVAMGSSLSDNAWGRDSAVYRVSGVISVVGGWLATAVIAFTVSALFALVIFAFELPAIAFLVLIAGALIYRTFRMHKKKETDKNDKEAKNEAQRTRIEAVYEETSERVAFLLKSVNSIIHASLDGLTHESRSELKEAQHELNLLHKKNEDLKSDLFHSIQRIEEDSYVGSRTYLRVFDFEQDVLQSLEFIVTSCITHVENTHSPIKAKQSAGLMSLALGFSAFNEHIQSLLEGKTHIEEQELVNQKRVLLLKVETEIAEQTTGIRQGLYNAKNSMLIFSLLLEIKDVIAITARFGKLFNKGGSSQYVHVDDNQQNSVYLN